MDLSVAATQLTADIVELCDELHYDAHPSLVVQARALHSFACSWQRSRALEHSSSSCAQKRASARSTTCTSELKTEPASPGSSPPHNSPGTDASRPAINSWDPSPTAAEQQGAGTPREFYFPCWLLPGKKNRRLSVGDIEDSKQKHSVFAETALLAHARCKSSNDLVQASDNDLPRSRFSAFYSATPDAGLGRAQSFRATPMSRSSRSRFNVRIPPYVTMRLADFQSSVARFKVFQHLRDLQKGTHECVEPRCPMLSRQDAVRPPATSGLYLDAGCFSMSNPEKTHGGEDAMFVSNSKRAIGVSDGVGEWSEFGINTRQFSQKMMSAAQAFADKGAMGGTASHNAWSCLDAGFAAATSARIPGAATSLIAALNAEGSALGIANLGDSACFVLRRDQRLFTNMTILRRTREQQHFFNCPYQLSFVPPASQFSDLEAQGLHSFVNLLKSMSESYCDYKSDLPEMCDLYDIAVKEGDLVICATDGLFDNLFDMEISGLVSDCLSPYEVDILKNCDELTKAWFEGMLMHPLAVEPPFPSQYTPPGAIAKALGQAAFARSTDPHASTPFGRNARKEGHRHLSVGGKLDDITVVVAWVKQ